MADLLNWSLTKGYEGKALSGLVIGHPKLKDGTVIHTSDIQTVTLVDTDTLKAITHSGTEYKLLVSEIDIASHAYDFTVRALMDFGIKESLFGDVQQLKELKEAKQIGRVVGLVNDGELLLSMTNESVVNAFYKQAGKVEMCTYYIHIGSYQDSVIVQSSGRVDFRYFPMAGACEVYHWSDELKVKIENIGSTDIVFKAGDKNFIIKQGEVKELSEEAAAEGLISPDCVNGKSMLSQSLINALLGGDMRKKNGDKDRDGNDGEHEESK